LVNLRYYNDKTYCEYKDWKDRICKKFHCTELHYSSTSNLTKILANKLCGDVTNKLNLMPMVRHEDRIKRMKIEFSVFPKEHSESEEGHLPRTSVNMAYDRETEYIMNLQNFKHELKTFFSPQQLVDYIFGFKFVGELGLPAADKEKLLLRRDAEEYFNYL
jgi:hypothetical protein